MKSSKKYLNKIKMLSSVILAVMLLINILASNKVFAENTQTLAEPQNIEKTSEANSTEANSTTSKASSTAIRHNEIFTEAIKQARAKDNAVVAIVAILIILLGIIAIIVKLERKNKETNAEKNKEESKEENK